jgi:replicative superfamily II helicase
MATRATFIGINKHLDPNIRELTGARRDATALSALFSDSIPGLSAELLVDDEATLEKIDATLRDSLDNAEEDDVVVLTFSGHGTHDHRLVTHNTVFGQLTDTTLSMDALALRLKGSKAKAVVCVLDCCFSGGAPARVLEGSAVPRSPTTPFPDIAGKGRILITASGIDEEAFELPGAGFGILTKALIDALCESDAPVGVTGVMGKVMERVRAEATRLGVIQTPVLFGYVEGGLTFPKFQIGPQFRQAFPEVVGLRIDGQIEDLARFGFPDRVLAEWKRNFSQGLNSLQREAVNEYRILDGESLLVVAPTSSGKTFIGEMAAVRAVLTGRKAVFLLPYRALVNEKFEQFEALYGGLGMRVLRCTGDYSDQTSGLVRGQYDIGILTYEMFLSLAVSNPAMLGQLGLIVLDEAQFITDPNRGINVELLLTLLITARERGIAPQLVVLSAVIGGINGFDEWLGCRRLVTTERPVPLIEGVIDRSGIFQFLDETGKPNTVQFLPHGSVRQRKDKASAQDVIVPLVRQLIQQNERVIVFRNQRGFAQGCAKYLADELGLPPASHALAQLPNQDLSTTSAELRQCLNAGTAFHNTNLTREEKTVVEQGYRDPKGEIAVLAATTTVAAGINTPASTVILAEKEFVGDDGRPFTIAEYKNMAGRAGRLGFNEKGKSMIYAETSLAREELFRRYVMGTPEPISSSFTADKLPTWLIRLLAQVKKVRRDDVARLLANTYGGYLASKGRPGWKIEIERQLNELLARMIQQSLVEQDGEFVRLTLLGRACGNSTLSLESALRLVELLRGLGAANVTADNLIAVVQALPESDGGYTPMMRRGRAETVRPGEASIRFGPDVVRLLQRHVDDEFDYLARCKRAAILWDWIHGEPIESIERKFSPNPFQGRIGHGDIRRFADNTRYHLRAAHQILNVLFIDQGPSSESIEKLLRQLEFGLPADALSLTALPTALSRGEYLALFARGVSAIGAFWKMLTNQLSDVLTSSRIAQLERMRPEEKNEEKKAG